VSAGSPSDTGSDPKTVPAAIWSSWQPLGDVPPINPAVLAEILDGGQAFRWQRNTGGIWLGIWANCCARLRIGAAGGIEWSAPTALQALVARALPLYFSSGCDQEALANALPWRSDPHLARCMTDFRGLRILRQPFGETLLGFLCSATKQIVQIKEMIAQLAARHGTPLAAGSTLATGASSPQGNKGTFGTVRQLPTWTELATLSETELRACRLGFRARYITETAAVLAVRPGWLEETEGAPYAQAKARLCALPGVGEKIADCVLLFGAGRLEAFPVDTWILQAMAARYGLGGWRPAQIAQFGRAHFGPGAGLAQQYLFAFERATARRRTAKPTGQNQRGRSISSTS
jgi:N-glycosylase/DNA lyase